MAHHALQELFPALQEKQLKLLKHFSQVLSEENQKLNLVSRLDIEELETHHLAHCLMAMPHLVAEVGHSFLDLGSGGGLPGIVLAIVFPNCHFTLLDKLKKKTLAQQRMVDALCLRNVKAIQGRAESLKGRFNWVLGRAVKPLPTFLPWAKPLLKPPASNLPQTTNNQAYGGGVLYWKGNRYLKELANFPLVPDGVFALRQHCRTPFFQEKYLLFFSTWTLRTLKAPQEQK